jgi:arabinoxylan arabinofuranohydrolase
MKKTMVLFVLPAVFCLIVTGCRNENKLKGELEALFSTAEGFPANLSDSWKIWGHHNAVFTHHFGADPTAMVYEGRVYLFTSNDTLLYDESGAVVTNGYGNGIQGIQLSSSADLVNWTDHGIINLVGTPSTNPLVETPARTVTYADHTWAPCAVWKEINDAPKFFLYWCNSGNGVGVFTADSPLGPWTSPRDSLLVDRNTPNCGDVVWLFDPGVFVDEDGRAYLFCGGGTNNVPADNTGQARRVRLGDDMISLDGEPETFYVPYLFEAMDMFKYGGRYYLTYCTNWGTGGTGGNRFGFANSEIAYMVAGDPMGTFGDPGGILRNASGQLASGDSNNHQGFFMFNDNFYITYHTQKPSQAMGITNGFNYRTASIDKVTVNPDGTIPPVTMTRKGIEQAGSLNPFVMNEAETIGIQGGVYTRPEPGASNGMVVTSIDTGDWLGVYGVDFGTAGAKKFTVRVRTPETPDYVGAIELRLDPAGDGVTGDDGNLGGGATTRITGGEVIGRIMIKAKAGKAGQYTDITVGLDKTVTGVHDLVFVFYSSLGVNPETVSPDTRHKNAFEFDCWQFVGK